MKRTLIILCPLLVSFEAQAISRYNSTSMSCDEVRATIAGDGEAITRYRSRRDSSHGNNSGGQFPDRGLGPRGEGACRDHLSIAGLICQPSGLANRHPGAADHRRGQHTCRAGRIAERSPQMAHVTGLVQKLLAPCGGQGARPHQALWQGRALQHGRKGTAWVQYRGPVTSCEPVPRCPCSPLSGRPSRGKVSPRRRYWMHLSRFRRPQDRT